MFGKSIKYQLVILSLLFSVFVAAVLFQMYFTHKMQYEEILQLKRSHQVISDYLSLEESERGIIENLRGVAFSKSGPLSPAELDEIQKRLDDWFEGLRDWKRFLSKWERDSRVSIKGSVFNENFLDSKKRQADAYGKCVSLCREGKMADVEHILNIESSFLPSVHKTIIVILEGVKVQVQNDRAIMERFYFSTAFAIMLALAALIFVSISIFRNITVNLRVLEEGARRISAGDFSKAIKLSSPVEISSLAHSFNDMQLAIKTRDQKIREDTEEIQKLNEVLEQKVIDRNKTIVQQNIALKRKNEELEQILYAASHDLRTPLISIQGFSEELKSACKSLQGLFGTAEVPDKAKVDGIIHEEIVMALNYIISGSKRMELLLEALLRISRMGRESLQIKPLKMNELMRNVMDNLSFQINDTGVELKIEELDDCSADASQFEQVFTNLISNAIKYRAEGGQCKIKVYSEKDSDFTRYYVQDNGIGISKEHLDRVFHAFYRVDNEAAEGEGVGLAIVNRALDLHNGRVWVESELGKGSTFIIEVPNVPY